MPADATLPPGPRPDPRPRGRLRWRVGTPVVVLLSGALFAVSAHNSGGTDLRPGRYTDLAGLADNEARRYQSLEGRVSTLEGQVQRLTAAVDDRAVRRAQARADQRKGPAGLTAESGPGVSVTLSDAPRDVIDEAAKDPDNDLNLYVVHQQDVQAVVNAMWDGGATAITIQGQRIVTTTGIKCSGNAIRLQGVPYPQPYVIEAVGEADRLQGAIATSGYLQVYREQAADPDIAIGYDESPEGDVDAPAYDGLLDLRYAKPLPTGG